MEHSVELSVDQEGIVLIVLHPNDHEVTEDLSGEVVEQRRGGYVLPVHPFKRKAFQWLRRTFGSKGRVADRTRSWVGPWMVVDAQTGKELPYWYFTHAEAVKAEVEYIIEELS